MSDNKPLTAVKLVTDESGKLVGVEDLERGQSIPIEGTSDSSEFVCEERPFTPYSTNVGGSRWGSIGDAIGRLADGIKEALEPTTDGIAGIFEGAKEFCATIIQKVKEEAVAQNMKKGAEDCAIKKEQSANKETGKKSDDAIIEGSACAMPDGGDGLQQATIKNNGEDLSRNEVGEDRRAGVFISEVEVPVSKKEDMPARTATVPQNSADAEDGSVADVGDKKIEQAMRDKAEQAEKIEAKKIEQEIAREMQDDADPDKASVEGLIDNGLAERDEITVSDVNSAIAQDERARDTIMAEASGERWVPFDPLPFAASDRIPLANGFDPPVSVGSRMEELFPAIVQNFIGCFTYLQLQRNAHENGPNSYSYIQATAGERGEQVWPAGKKEGGDNHSDHGSSSDQGQDRGEEKPENNFVMGQ